MKASFLAIIMLWLISTYGQNFTKQDKEKYKKANTLFLNEEYNNAREIFYELVTKYPEHFECNYYLGACYLNTRYLKSEAIPYLKKASEEKESTIPSIVHKDLGDLYHQTYQFDIAINHYRKYIKIAPRNDSYLAYSKMMIQTCINAKELVKDTINVQIKNIGLPINTKNSEFAPFVSADDSILFFTRKIFYTDEELLSIKNPDTISHLFVSIKINNEWNSAIKVTPTGIDLTSEVSIAGMSADGEYIYINAINKGQQDIYSGRYLNNGKLELKPLPPPINTEYWEGKITISPNGNTIWFSSNRPGGTGGKDIYKSERINSNEWSEPVNVGPEINTPYDEDAPFIHPSENIFYFSSKGHNSIGGYDVFNVLLSEKHVFPAKNMGFPINTPSDDMYFALSANGESGYFSSAYGNKYENHDIYQIKMDLNIPLTILKGTILAGTPPKPIAAKIRVIEKQSGKKLRYVYNPNPETGNYLLILPPGKDYTMIIESEDFLPQNINIQIPDQKEFYELFQTIRLFPIVSLGKVVGEKLQVNNSFEEKKQSTPEDKNYDELFNLIDMIITQTDTIDDDVIETRGITEEIENEETVENNMDQLFNLIEQAFELGDTAILNQIQENTIIPDKYERVYLYSENIEPIELNKIVVGNDTLFTSPKIITYNKRLSYEIARNDLIGVTVGNSDSSSINDEQLFAEKIISPITLRKSKEYERRTILMHSIYFAPNQYTANDSIRESIEEIAKLLVNNANLGIVVAGFTDHSGDVEYNKKLSQKRSFWFIEKLKDYGVNTSKAIIQSFGEEKASKNSIMKQDRRIDITLFEIKKNINYAL